ncbi:interferon-induced 35 kDa protein isoform X1 [Bufo gargarizans]|uniref:interferon-induced 35 kDa protein isoform X1 n=1 Tax=Bufo gargarizans TaxID=30331 RepID=UPI001CF2FA0A|nr:interferon-induced 35 kDa protein isoform X1 [Bufo gargarizans]
MKVKANRVGHQEDDGTELTEERYHCGRAESTKMASSKEIPSDGGDPVKLKITLRTQCPSQMQEDFVHVGNEKVQEEYLIREIKMYKEKHAALLEDISKLELKKNEAEVLAQKFHDRAEKEEKKLMTNEQTLFDLDQKFQEKVRSLREQNQQLKAEEQSVKDKVIYLENETENLEAICSSEVEGKIVFKGKVSNNISSKCGINVKHQIRYPVKGGTALIVFEEPSVAARLIQKKHLKVEFEEFEDFYMKVQAEPVELMVLDDISMDISRSPRKILVSNLPASKSKENLLDKIELFFTKTKNGGGEVDGREFLDDSRSVILTFVDEGVAPQLVEKKKFDVPFGDEETHQVFVSPSLEGDMTRYVMKNLLCNRTVLITGIPDITDEETLRDLLELHFRKTKNDGGEVVELLYCPEGKNAVALFEDDEDNFSQKE